jgi:hypothetical protein
MLKTTQAKSLVFELRDAVRQWDSWSPTPDQMASWQGEAVKPIAETLHQLIAKVGEAFRTTRIEKGAWELALAFDRFYAEFGRWALSLSVAPDAVDPGGTPEMWSAWRGVLKVADQRKPPPPPHAVVLQSQGCNIRTIAVRFGWTNEDGQPDTARVNRELAASPEDREYDPDNWTHPRERKFYDELKIQFDERCEKLQKEQDANNPRTTKREPSKESWESLFEMPYMSIRQIALMKMVTEDDVREKMEELGYVKCAEGFRRAHESGRVKRGDKEPEFLSRHNPHDEFGDDIEARVMACMNDGLKAKSIADLLSGARNLPVTVQQVAKIIKDNREKQETAA